MHPVYSYSSVVIMLINLKVTVNCLHLKLELYFREALDVYFYISYVLLLIR